MTPRWICLVILTLCGPWSVSARAETIHVTIDKLLFSPAEVSAKVGDTIEWTNKDILAHTATAKDEFDVVIAPKATGRVVLKKAGAVDYFCKYHPNMKARATVAP